MSNKVDWLVVAGVMTAQCAVIFGIILFIATVINWFIADSWVPFLMVGVAGLAFPVVIATIFVYSWIYKLDEESKHKK